MAVLLNRLYIVITSILSARTDSPLPPFIRQRLVPRAEADNYR